MAENAPHGRPTLHPFLRYRDARAAVRWLRDAFGFEEKAVFEGPDGDVVHAELRLGDGVMMLGPAKEDALGMRTPREVGAVTGGIYAFVEDVEAHHRRAVAAGAEVVNDLREMEYGSREYSCRDPEGNLWSFGTYRP
ncbi:MAG TPA: VOC family protein [Longimicrobiaceae bacterium]|nr:VOC family protein [Longimicrobiaceae bacterium]